MSRPMRSTKRSLAPLARLALLALAAATLRSTGFA
jgi:hypothetical protein